MNTYDRSLLADVPEAPILQLLQSARGDLRALRNDVGEDISTALDLRLELRVSFLRAIDLMSLRTANPDSLKTPWIEMQGLIDQISNQHPLARQVPGAFSTKLQRRLASTMPPRPIVQTSFEETCGHYKQMFRDGVDITEVLKYSDPQSLLVRIRSPGVVCGTNHTSRCSCHYSKQGNPNPWFLSGSFCRVWCLKTWS